MEKFNYTYSDIVDTFKNVGLSRGDVVFTHTNLGFCGRLKGCVSMDELCDTFRRAFVKAIGDEGTLVVPTFSYSFCRKEAFDVRHTPTTCGAFSEYIRTYPDAMRSEDANFSVCALGRKAEEFTRDMPELSFGPQSFWERLHAAGGKICNINFDAGSTFIHYVERCLKVAYRYDKCFDGTFMNADGVESARRYCHFVYDLERPQDSYNPEGLAVLLQSRGLLARANLGKGRVTCLSAQELYCFVEEALRSRPRLLTKIEEE